MCGIICEIFYSKGSALKDAKILKRIKNRGPDLCIHHAFECSIDRAINLLFHGAVLWMQGPSVTSQPVIDENGILLYNGDIFDNAWNKASSDTESIMKKLRSCKNDTSGQKIVEVLKTLKGPFSIIYYDKTTYNLVFTRDRIGRNTLLFHRNEGSIVISSVLGRNYKCIEVPATHIHILNLKTNKITLYSWTTGHSKVDEVGTWLENLKRLQNLPDEEFTFSADDVPIMDLEDNLLSFIELAILENKCKQTFLRKIMDNIVINETVSKLTELLKRSVKVRVEKQPQKCKDCLKNESKCSHSSTGILFSGGLDCTILAFLADKFIPEEQSIDLINVAFKKDEKASYEVPDRITGRQSLEELKKLCKTRKWVFREVDVPKEELEMCQRTIIADLVHPRQTILDESLGSALWFAARGQNLDSVSPCRVLLLGSGADELFGGYTRHRNAFKRCGWSGLQKELQLDWRRISFRNLARDNRVICDHGRQPRMPYLDEDFTEYVLNLKPWLKCYPSESLGQGVGDKLMLRLVALHLGLRDVVTFPKRALQFGSRIANKKEKGCDVSKNFIEK